MISPLHSTQWPYLTRSLPALSTLADTPAPLEVAGTFRYLLYYDAACLYLQPHAARSLNQQLCDGVAHRWRTDHS